VRIERIGLEDHGEAAPVGRHVVRADPVDQEIARGDLLEAGDHPEQRRLPASRRPDKDHELAVPDHKVDALDHLGGAEGLAEGPDLDCRHRQFLVT
jgi:hypothetical protein